VSPAIAGKPGIVAGQRLPEQLLVRSKRRDVPAGLEKPFGVACPIPEAAPVMNTVFARPT